MNRFLATALLLALPAAAEVRFGLETQGYPLLPSFYERTNKRFSGLSASVPVLPRLAVQAGISHSFKRWDGPYNDVSNYNGSTLLLRGGAEYQLFQAGPARLFLGAGLLRMTSFWDADDHAYEDPPGPQEFWTGSFSHWSLEAAPRVELFRENQKVDWTLSLALPYYLAFATDLKDRDKALEERFREDYLNDAGMGIRLTIGLAFGS